MALEPLIPGAPIEYDEIHLENFNTAWKEFVNFIRPKVCVFVGVYSSFVKLLKLDRFQFVKIGQEPWLELKNYLPKGNSGKGVRSARNQAIRSGMWVEEWASKDIILSKEKLKIIQNLFENWKSNSFIRLGGFMNSTNPTAYSDIRRYFVAKDRNGIVRAYLIATPVFGISSYFIEDMVMCLRAPRGTGELLTIESLAILAKENVNRASLGVVSATALDVEASFGLPKKIETLILKIPQILFIFYNFNGLEIFRKRFKPEQWDGIYLAVRNFSEPTMTDNQAWFEALLALFLAFKPRINISLKGALTWIGRRCSRYPIMMSVSFISSLFFILFNRGGQLPQSILEKYGFSASAPFHEWFMRSIVSDLLYFDPVHFFLWGIVYFILLFWAEKTNRKPFFLIYFILLTTFDDFINYLCIVKPFSYFQPNVFMNMITYKDVGGSLCMMTLLGLQLCRFRKNREIFFILIAVGSVFGFAFEATQIHTLVINLNHFLFFSLGYVSGKIKFEVGRAKSRSASHGKPLAPNQPSAVSHQLSAKTGKGK